MEVSSVLQNRRKFSSYFSERKLYLLFPLVFLIFFVNFVLAVVVSPSTIYYTNYTVVVGYGVGSFFSGLTDSFGKFMILIAIFIFVLVIASGLLALIVSIFNYLVKGKKP
jgi:ABC-type transport system involved in multi-copper enzyme maturation permease subunit